MTRSLVTTLINSLLHLLLVSLFGKGILKILSSLFLLDVEQPKIEQFAPGIWKNCEHTRREIKIIHHPQQNNTKHKMCALWEVRALGKSLSKS